MNLQASPADPCEMVGRRVHVLKRFLIALAIFVSLVIPGALMMALLAAAAYPEPTRPGSGYAVTESAADSER